MYIFSKLFFTVYTCVKARKIVNKVEEEVCRFG